MTRNHDYNALLAQWARQGFPTEPACEDCGVSLVDRDVICTGTMWCCKACAAKDADYEYDDSREDFHADG